MWCSHMLCNKQIQIHSSTIWISCHIQTILTVGGGGGGGGRKLFQKVIDVTLGLCKYVETTCGFRDHALTNQIAETIFFNLRMNY